jgi:hypothetical protein
VQLTPRNARKRVVFLRAQGRTAVPMQRWSGHHELRFNRSAVLVERGPKERQCLGLPSRQSHGRKARPVARRGRRSLKPFAPIVEKRLSPNRESIRASSKPGKLQASAVERPRRGERVSAAAQGDHRRLMRLRKS